ncbi:MAG: hypothetical protein J2P17_01360 [Mycobacterium sp.]|nr:hypothetical protein [Mycobacterium sp.]
MGKESSRPVQREPQPVAVVGPGWVQAVGQRKALEVAEALDVLRLVDFIPLGHRLSAPQIWFLSEVVSRLGMEFYPADPDAPTSARAESVEKQLEVAGQEFLASAVQAGWVVQGEGLAPRTTLVKSDPVNPRSWRAVQLVLEPYQWIYDTRSDAVTGDDDAGTGLSEDPVVRADQIVRRIAAVDDLFEVLPASTPGATAAKLLDVKQQSKHRAARRGKTSIDAAGRNRQRLVTEPGVIPPLDGRAGIGGEVFQALAWARHPSAEEIERARWAVLLDQRWAYPSVCRELWLGYGQPTWVETEQARELACARADKTNRQVFALWRCEPLKPDIWDPAPEGVRGWHPRIFAPHDDLRNPDGPTWLFPTTVETLLKDRDQCGCAVDLADLNITGAWVWPAAGRMLEPWYKAELKTVTRLRAMDDPTGDLDDDQRAWLNQFGMLPDGTINQDLRTWLTRFAKSVGRAGIGRLNSDVARRNATDPHNPKPWRYQPVWWEAVKAACAAKLWEQGARLASKYGIWPIQASTDGMVYLIDHDTMSALEDDELQDQRLGVLKLDKLALLEPGVAEADQARERLARLGGRRPTEVITWYDGPEPTLDTTDDDEDR